MPNINPSSTLPSFLDPSSPDVGWIEVQQGETLLAKIEIKATRGIAVSMSNAQGEEASNDLAQYWL